MPRRFATIAAATALAVAAAASMPASAGPLQSQLARTMPELKFDGIALGDALDFLRDVSGANMHVDWKALEGAGVNKDTPVNVRLRGVSLRKTLNTLVSQAGEGDAIGWTTDEGVIEVTTKEKINATTYTRIYDIRDLLVEIPDFDQAPDFSLQKSADSNSQGGGGGGGGGLFSQNGGEKEKEVGKTKDERAEDILTLIRDTISPDIWSENGGTASIKYFNGNIVVRAPKYVHEAIGGAWD